MVDMLSQVAIYIACGLGAALGNPIVRAVLTRIERPAKQGRGRETLLSAQKELSGGRWIGVLERLCIYLSIVCAYPAGLALVLAIKGLGRYPELKNDNDARIGELFIIGTLLSGLWALAWAGIAVGLIALIH